MAILNGAPTREGEIADRFSQVLEQYIAPSAFAEVVAGLRSTVSDTWEISGRTSVVGGVRVMLDAAQGRWELAIAVDDAGDIETLLISPAPEATTDTPESLSEVVEELAELGDVSLAVYDVTSGTCDPQFVAAEDSVRPIGSTFKLYVLGAVADAVARGDLAWEDELAIRGDLKSLPSGTFQTRPVGSTATVLAFAEAMISNSDNTATDHLIDLVGREAVEAAMTDYGNANADESRPFLSTREFFALKLAAPGDVVEAWVDGSEATRRGLLEETIADLDVTISDAVTWVAPFRIDEIEWFATALDQCRALAGLMSRSTIPDLAEIRGILSINPGVPIDSSTWSYAAFKGGSEPGVLNLAWYLEAVDGPSHVYVVNVTDPDALLAESEVISIAGAGIGLILP